VKFPYQLIFFISFFGILLGFSGLPNRLKSIDDFVLDRYLGNWYEIARFDYSFHLGFYDVRASYLMKEYGGIEVRNLGTLP